MSWLLLSANQVSVNAVSLKHIKKELSETKKRVTCYAAFIKVLWETEGDEAVNWVHCTSMETHVGILGNGHGGVGDEGCFS